MVSAQWLTPAAVMHPNPNPLPPTQPTTHPVVDATGGKDHRVQIQVRDVDVDVVDDAYASDVDSDASTARPLVLSSSSDHDPDHDLHNTATLLESDSGKLLLASGKLVEAEARAEGRVSLKSYWTYIKAAGLWAWVMTFVLLVLIRVINVGNQVCFPLLSLRNGVLLTLLLFTSSFCRNGAGRMKITHLSSGHQRRRPSSPLPTFSPAFPLHKRTWYPG